MSRIRSTTVSVPLRALLAAVAVLPLTCCDQVKPAKAQAQDEELYDYSSAVRWSDFNKAYDFVDPETKKTHPLTDLEKERFKQVEVSGYVVMNKVEGKAVIDQEVKLDLINRHTQIPRSMVYHEHWRWDEAHKYWWLTTGLPDITPQDQDQD